MDDIFFMQAALREAEKAFKKKETPVGAIAVQQGKIIARAHNLREHGQNPLGHAEILLIQKTSKKMKSWRLGGVTIYVTLEPCLMCLGALLQARVTRLVFGAPDPKAGACGSFYDLDLAGRGKKHLHTMSVTSSILGRECGEILSGFFEDLRRSKKNKKK